MPMYDRVLPRDLFNESKLLKCLGQLALLVHDGKAGWLGFEFTPAIPYRGFIIEQDPSDGGLFCANLEWRAGEARLDFYSNYNSKASYPLTYTWSRDDLKEGGSGEVFNDDGTLTDEFRSLVGA